MLKTWFSKHKWILVAALLLAYSVFVWDVSSKVTDNAYSRERLRHSEQIITMQVENDKLLGDIRSELQASEERLKKQGQQDRKDLLDELAKDDRYRTCTVTPGVRDLYKRKLQSQR